MISRQHIFHLYFAPIQGSDFYSFIGWAGRIFATLERNYVVYCQSVGDFCGDYLLTFQVANLNFLIISNQNNPFILLLNQKFSDPPFLLCLENRRFQGFAVDLWEGKADFAAVKVEFGVDFLDVYQFLDVFDQKLLNILINCNFLLLLCHPI